MSKIFLFRFQEIVPLSAGNVLVSEDNEPAAKWLTLISQAINKPRNESISYSPDSISGSRVANNNRDAKSNNFFHKPSLKLLSKNFRADSSLLKICNCPVESTTRDRRRARKLSDAMTKLESGTLHYHQHSGADELIYMADLPVLPCVATQMSYSLIASKQMVGIFLSVWARKELVPHIGHLRISSVQRGIMGCLGNKVS